MEIIGGILMAIGIALSLFGGIWFLIVAFRESIVWGLLCLFINIVSLIFLIVHFDKAAKPFAVQVLGILLLFAGLAIISNAKGNEQLITYVKPAPELTLICEG